MELRISDTSRYSHDTVMTWPRPNIVRRTVGTTAAGPLGRSAMGALLVCFLVVTDVAAKNLFVQNSGCSDATTYANNSQGQPWCTLQRALCGNSTTCLSGLNAAESAKAGDTVLVAPGAYVVGPGSGARYKPALNPVNSGTSNNPVTIRKNGTGNVDIRLGSGQGPVIGACGLPECGGPRNYIIWDGMHVVETASQNVSVSDTGPVVFFETTGSQLLNSTLIGNDIPDRGDNHVGIRVELSANVLIANNSIEGFRSSGSNAANGACLQMYTSTGVVIEHNVASNCGSGFFVKGDNDAVTIRYNKTTGNDMGYIAYYQGLDPNACQNFHNNISNGDNWGIVFWRFSRCVNAVNNTFVNNNEAIVPFNNTDGWINVRWYNNIVASCSKGIGADNLSSTAGGNGNYNLVNNCTNFGAYHYTYYATKAGFNAATGWETNTLTADPLFVNAATGDFHLRSGSPAINAGIDVLDLDHDGQTSDPITMGAYITGSEVIGVTSSSPSTCGNGVLDAGEQCDGSNLNGQTCQSLGYSGGTLTCNSCTFNTSACTTAPPSAPTGLQATAVTYGEIDLSWTDTSSNEAGFEIDRKIGATGTYAQIATTAANVSTYKDTTVNATTTYYYRVRATNSGGDSANSNEATATTPAGPDLNSGLVGYWRFDEGAGTTTADASGNSGTGILVNNPTWTTGRTGGALLFNGASNYVNVNDSTHLDLGAQGSIVVWIKRGSTGAWASILSKGTSNADTAQNYAIEFNPADQLEMKFGNGTQENVLVAPAITDVVNFHHVAFVWTGTQLFSYLDGSQNASTPQTITPATNPAAVLVGQFSADVVGNNQDPFNGVIDELRIYNRALTPQEIQTLFNGAPISGQNPGSVTNVRRADSR